MKTSFRTRALVGAIACSVAIPSMVGAQSASYRVEPSGRATTTVSLTRVGTPAGGERPAPARITIDYGQPHLRGRDVLTLMPMGAEWRLGANTSTSITTDLDLVIGGASVPKGTYTLWTIRSANGTKLIINKQTGQWGTQYNAAQDLARVDMRTKKLTQPLEALQIALVPSQNGPSGVLRVTWGTVELETDWSVKQ